MRSDCEAFSTEYWVNVYDLLKCCKSIKYTGSNHQIYF